MPSITEALRQSPEVAALLCQSEQQTIVQTVITNVLPGVMPYQRCRIKISDNRLTLIAPNNAFSTKLRQLEPTILSRLAQQGIHFTHIRILASKIQFNPEPEPLYIDKPPLSSVTCARLNAFAQQINHLPRASKAIKRIADSQSNDTTGDTAYPPSSLISTSR